MIKQFSAFKYIFFYFFFWIAISCLDRALFLFFAAPPNADLGFGEIIDIYRYGFKMDLSMAAYISVLPLLGFFVWSLIPSWQLSKRWLLLYSYVILFITAVITSVSINLYPEWTEKFSRKAIDNFLNAPQEVVASASSSTQLLSFLIFISFFLFGAVVFHFLFRNGVRKWKGSWYVQSAFFLIIAFLLFTCIRGGYGKSTLNGSVAYHSSKSFNNHAAVNSYWDLISDYVNGSIAKENPYQFFDTDTEVEAILAPLLLRADSSVNILNSDRPNVVFLILESFTADLVSHLNGISGTSPQLDALAKEGLSFVNMYSAAERSDKGIVAIFSGFPAQGHESVIKSIKKQEKLPAIGQAFKAHQYNTAFYHGGQSEFYNFRSYMLAHGIDRIVDKASFKSADHQLSWGVDDAIVLAQLNRDLDKEKQLFFYSFFSINNHEPFDLVVTPKFGNDSELNKIKSTAYYTDSVVGEFIKAAKTKDWYANTVFIITADHGHRLPYNREVNDPQRFHIPCIIVGGALKDVFKGKRISKVSSQVDIAGTLLTQLKWSTAQYPFSRNLMDTSSVSFASFNTSNSWGIISGVDTLVMDFNHKDAAVPAGKEHLSNQLKAYNQKVFEQFLKL